MNYNDFIDFLATWDKLCIETNQYLSKGEKELRKALVDIAKNRCKCHYYH